MTGNELDIAISHNPPIRPEEIVGQWLRDKGAECARLTSDLTECQQALLAAKASRARAIETLQAIAVALGLPYPDPKKMLAAIDLLLKESHGNSDAHH